MLSTSWKNLKNKVISCEILWEELNLILAKVLLTKVLPFQEKYCYINVSFAAKQ
jgi:hypothetical protein